MLVHWTSLVGFGFAFWILLCLTDLLGGKPRGYPMRGDEHSEVNYENEILDDFKDKVLKFGWSLALWNSLAFITSLVFCNLARFALDFIWRSFIYYRKHGVRSKEVNNIEAPTSAERSNSSLSKIPIMMKSSPNNLGSSDTNFKVKPRISSDASCPNLRAPKRSPSNISRSPSDRLPKCRMLTKITEYFRLTTI
ncbi:hypothetical protein JTB14_003479 [Gonioctena quinquepunctata]|nr:hypothetical protein JTB14_003479 [Gonioctena quinquepunctata]